MYDFPNIAIWMYAYLNRDGVSPVSSAAVRKKHCVPVEVIHQTSHTSDQAARAARYTSADSISRHCFLLLYYVQPRSDDIQQSYDQASFCDGTEGVCHCSLEGTACGMFGLLITHAEIPRSEYAGNGRERHVGNDLGCPAEKERRNRAMGARERQY
jgi:hypothetical protein